MKASDKDLISIHAAIQAGLEKGVLCPVVGKVMALGEAARAHAEIMSEGANGKIVLIPENSWLLFLLTARGETPMEMSHLLEFFGTECVHCKKLEPLIERLEDELGVAVTRLEVWHNQANATLLKKFDQGFCGGVPFFYNTRTDKWLCGDPKYEVLKEWAQG